MKVVRRVRNFGKAASLGDGIQLALGEGAGVVDVHDPTIEHAVVDEDFEDRATHLPGAD